MSDLDSSYWYGFDLPLPRRGVLSGKSLRTSRRWRLFFVRSLLDNRQPHANQTARLHLAVIKQPLFKCSISLCPGIKTAIKLLFSDHI
jgi:hypothetical protein